MEPRRREVLPYFIFVQLGEIRRLVEGRSFRIEIIRIRSEKELRNRCSSESILTSGHGVDDKYFVQCTYTKQPPRTLCTVFKEKS